MNLSYFRQHDFTWLVGHYWSLSTEEQFYIVFPLLLKKNHNAFIGLLLFLTIGIPICCVVQELYAPANNLFFYAFTHMAIKFDAIAIGCIFSVICFNEKLFGALLKFKTPGNIAALSIIFYLKVEFFYSINSILLNTLVFILIGYFIVSNIKPGTDLIFTILNNKALSFVGVLSYSIYIWQQIFTSGETHLPDFVITFPYKLGLIAIVSLASYFFYEKAFLKLKTKFKTGINSTPSINTPT
jgi:peptidoglycan/LPS O-acetylase OafA/YrhL